MLWPLSLTLMSYSTFPPWYFSHAHQSHFILWLLLLLFTVPDMLFLLLFNLAWCLMRGSVLDFHLKYRYHKLSSTPPCFHLLSPYSLKLSYLSSIIPHWTLVYDIVSASGFVTILGDVSIMWMISVDFYLLFWPTHFQWSFFFHLTLYHPQSYFGYLHISVAHILTWRLMLFLVYTLLYSRALGQFLAKESNREC